MPKKGLSVDVSGFFKGDSREFDGEGFFVPFKVKRRVGLGENVDDDELRFRLIKEEDTILLDVTFTKTDEDGPAGRFDVQVLGVQRIMESCGDITLQFPAKVFLKDITSEMLLGAIIATKGKFFLERHRSHMADPSIYLVVEVPELGISCCSCISDVEKWEDFFEVED